MLLHKRSLMIHTVDVIEKTKAHFLNVAYTLYQISL